VVGRGEHGSTKTSCKSVAGVLGLLK
jgi:hypothetical protein